MTEEFGYGVFQTDMDRFLELEESYAKQNPSAHQRTIAKFINKQIEKNNINHKRCCICKKVKSLDDYYKDGSKTSGYEAYCKSCKPLPTFSLQRMWTNYKAGSKKRGINFDIDREVFEDLIQSPCYYCGKKVKYIESLDTSSFNGVDRVENHRGYEKDNVVSCCSTCNFAKHTLPQQEFIEMCQRVANHQKEKSNLHKKPMTQEAKDVEKMWISNVKEGKISQMNFDYPVW